MSQQFFYIHFRFTPKIRTDAILNPHPREVVVEVPRDLIYSGQSKSTHEKAVAIDLARRVALGTFPTLAERVIGLYDEDPPIWYEDRHHAMNERPCDQEENGARAWRLA